jgi:undecaprenyl-diphosphatase
VGWWEAALLGLVQGLTEFLPVSSDGHLVIAETLLGMRTDGIVFEVAVHVGTLVAVLWYYRERLRALLAGVLAGAPEALRYTAKLAVATVPAVLAALLARDFFERQFDRPAVAGLGLLATGTILMTTRWTQAGATQGEPGWLHALLIGCAQVAAILPGVSRSGCTVAAALGLRVAPLAAAEFSFLMSIPAIAGAAVLQLPDLLGLTGENGLDGPHIALGTVVAAVSGLGAIWLFVRILRARRFHQFAWYAWAAGAVFLAWLHYGSRIG